MLFYIIILIIFGNSRSSDNFNYCQIGSSGKCLGDTMQMYDIGVPLESAGYLLSYQADYGSCSNFCALNIDCYMASFNFNNNTCNLYRNIFFEHSTFPTIKLFLWYCCNTNYSYDPKNRCPGYWKYQPQAKSDNKIRPSDPLKEILDVSLFSCQLECLNNNICGAVNYLKKDSGNSNVDICQLLIQFPVEYLHISSVDNWSTYQWQCASNYTLPEPSKECTERVNHFDGYWSIQNVSIHFIFSKKQLIYFNTLNFIQCLNNCEIYSKCKTAWYSRNSYLCILEAAENSHCADTTPENNYKFTTYIWKNCNELQTRNTHQRSACKKLINNRYVYINPIKCGQVPFDLNNLYKCWEDPETNHGTIFSHNLHCQQNQLFRVFDKVLLPSIVFKEFTKYRWLRAYTGYDNFWLVNVSAANIISASDEECKIFDANIDDLNLQSLTIIKNKDWFPSKSTKKENPFPNYPVKYVIITDTEVPFCNCFSMEACSAIMRRIQLALQPTFFSIPYSFIITGDGIVYEARGWDFEPAAAGGMYNSNSFVIAFCGQYKKRPEIQSLVSAKKLIQLSVNLKKVSENYTLYIYNDIRNRPVPYDGLRRVIELWPHYRGHIKDACEAINKASIILNIIATITCFALLIVFIALFYHKIWHKKYCFHLREFRIETMYGNLFTKSKEVLPQIIFQPLNNLKYEENFISPVTSFIYWIEDCQTINEMEESCKCKGSISSIVDLCYFQSNLVNIGSFTLLEDIRCCSKTIVFIFQRNREIGNGCLLILHLRFVKSFYRFLFKLYQNKCICDFYNVTKYEYTSKYSINTNKHNEDNKHNVLKVVHSRETLEKIYSFSIEPKNNLRYFN